MALKRAPAPLAAALSKDARRTSCLALLNCFARFVAPTTRAAALSPTVGIALGAGVGTDACITVDAAEDTVELCTVDGAGASGTGSCDTASLDLGDAGLDFACDGRMFASDSAVPRRA